MAKWHQDLQALYERKDWNTLFEKAAAQARATPKEALAFGWAAHALRHLQRLEEGFDWAQRGLAVDDEDLFVLNRASLLANLTGRAAVAWNLAVQNVARRPTRDGDRFNFAVLLVNGIHAAARLGRVTEAVTRFSPAIEALDHPELHFNAACLYALARDERAIDCVRKALHHDKPKADFGDADFDSLRADPRFVAALARDWQREKAALARAKTAERALLTPEHFVEVSKLQLDGDDVDERSPELEAALLTSAASPDVAMVYADWFEERGNPRARFIRASMACHTARTEDERMQTYPQWADELHTHAARLLGPLAESLGDDVRVGWKFGFISSLEAPSTVLPLVFEHPSYRALRALRVKGHVELATVERAFPALRGLWLCDDALEVGALDLHFPQLETLGLEADELHLGRLRFDGLRELSLNTSLLEPAHVAPLRNLPRLEVLSLIERDGTECEVDDYDAMFELHALRRLRLSVHHVDELCARLGQAKLTTQLEVLDLSNSPLTDTGAEALRRHAKQFEQLARIDVRRTSLSDEARRELQRVLPNVMVND